MSRHEAGPAPQLDRPARSGGRHRKPSSPGAATAVITTGTFAIVPFMMSAGTAQAAELAPAAGLDAIAKCESGGNPQAQNSGSTASGLYQFLDSSWRAYGGSKYGPRAKDATPAQQTEIAHAAVARSGLTPWKASQHCWGGQVSTASINASKPAAPKPVIRQAAPKPATVAPVRPTIEAVSAIAPRHAAAPEAPSTGRHAALPAPRTSQESAGTAGTYKVRPGDSLSRIAKSYGTDWQSLWEANKSSVRSPHSLHPGEELKLPRAADLSHSGHGSASFIR